MHLRFGPFVKDANTDADLALEGCQATPARAQIQWNMLLYEGVRFEGVRRIPLRCRQTKAAKVVAQISRFVRVKMQVGRH